MLALLLCATLLSAAPAAASPAAQDGSLELTAVAAIVVEYPSGKVLYTKNAYEALPMASTTKIMTAVLALQRLSLDEVVTVKPEALVGEASMGLVADEQVTVRDLLYGLMLPSGNDAAMTLAIAAGEKLSEPANLSPLGRFVNLMNEQAQAMGLTNTHFANPHGLDAPGHYTTAADLASITWYALHDPTFNEIIKTVSIDVPNHPLFNLNELLTMYEGVDGVKTGLTDNAGLCLVSSATRDGRRIIAVVLNAYRWYDDSIKLLDYGFSTDPNGAGGLLTIAQRSELVWLLANGLPDALPTPRPTELPVSQGAGTFLDISNAPVASEPQIGPNTAPLAESAATPPLDGTAQFQTASDGGNWLVPIIALIVGAGALALYWRNYGSRRMAAPAAEPSWEEKKNRLAGMNGSAVPAGSASRAKQRVGRVPLEPKRISLMDDDSPEQHAKRGIALAYRGQEGSSLAEFMMAVQRNPEFEFGSLDGFYDMPPSGYLSLARAYAENNRRHYAKALLQLGVETYPEEKAIKKMLAELEPAAV